MSGLVVGCVILAAVGIGTLILALVVLARGAALADRRELDQERWTR